MAAKREPAAGSELGELLAVESSVLRTLCLTINAPGSVLKDRILDSLATEDFYFPINQALFAVLEDMNLRGDYVVCSNLGDQLKKLGVGFPEGFFLEDLFRGDLPKAPEVTEWVCRLKEQAAKRQPVVPPSSTEAPPKVAVTTEAPPAVATRADAVPPPAGRASDAPQAAAEGKPTPSRPSPESRKGALASEKQSKARTARSSGAEGTPRQGIPPTLSSEGEEWGSYLQEVAAKQGKRFETGFAGLDEAAAGLFPGVMLLGDENLERLTGFLKQLTDQIAARSKVPCLYLSFEVPKAALRVRTLARLSGVPARDIEKGRIKKGSPEWESVERQGKEAAEWLKWVFIVEADRGMELPQVQDAGRRLLESTGASTCLVVVDNLAGLVARGDPLEAVVADLKEVSEALDALVIAGTADKGLSSDSGVDYLAGLHQGQAASVELELLRAEDARSTTVAFEYQPDICRFREQPAA